MSDFHFGIMHSALEEMRPYDLGFNAGITQGTLFDCPYGHAVESELRRRHEWLEGYLTGLAEVGGYGLL